MAAITRSLERREEKLKKLLREHEQTGKTVIEQEEKPITSVYLKIRQENLTSNGLQISNGIYLKKMTGKRAHRSRNSVKLVRMGGIQYESIKP